MLTFFSFIFMFVGSLNWFFISVFQYDFVAGFFGTQASLLSRFIYFIIGIAGFVMAVIAVKKRGKIKLFENPFKNKQNQTVTPVNIVPSNDDEQNFKTTENNFILPSEQKFSNEGYKDFDVTKYDK